MPFIPDDKKPDFLQKPIQPMPHAAPIGPAAHAASSPVFKKPDLAVKKPEEQKEKPNPFDAPHLQRSKLYRELLNNPDVKKQAQLEGKKRWDLARELVGEFSPERYGSSIEPYEVKKQLYLDSLKMKHQQMYEPNSVQKYANLKRERQEHSLWEKIFGHKK